MDIPAGIAAQSALTRQNITLSVIKQAAQADQAVANILKAAVENSPLNTGSRGRSVNIKA